MIIDPTDLDAASNYKLLIGSVIPRPIAWVSTVSKDGVGNLAPISFFTVVGRKPPRVSLTLQPRADGVNLKDTFVNIRDTGEFVSNMATFPHAADVQLSAVDYPADVDEFEVLGLDAVPSTAVVPPRLAEAPIALECKVFKIFSSPDGLGNVVWADVVRFYVRDDLYLPSGRIDIPALSPIGRLAAEFSVTDTTFVPPLEPDELLRRSGQRMRRLDGRNDDFAAVDSVAWSASGAVAGD
ncbi:flavin reductase family protein [Paenarthrobacter sp. NPDC089322]|uniref:flavin reductase family protein n=1 Tax=Paenarthrobacter sp. NPDC089322 TaxID=3155065 RepID=UPI00342C2669